MKLKMKGNQMANAVKTTKSEVAVKAEETLVVLSPKTQRSVKALREAHNLEKVVKEQISVARTSILETLGEGVDLVGVDAKGKRLLRLKVVHSSSPRIDNKGLVDYLTKNNPEILEMFILPDSEPTTRVLTL